MWISLAKPVLARVKAVDKVCISLVKSGAWNMNKN